jgi:hypothetical protein
MNFCSVFNPTPSYTSITVTGLTPTRVVFVGASDELTDSSNFTFNSTTRVLSIGASGSLGGIFLYPFNIGYDSQSQLYFQNSLAGTSNFRLYTLNGIATENAIFQIYGKGTPATATTLFERLQIGWDSANAWYTISSVVTGTPTTVRPIRIYTGTNTTQMILNINGTVTLGGVAATDSLTLTAGNFVVSAGYISASSYINITGGYISASTYMIAGKTGTGNGSFQLKGITSGTVVLTAQNVAGTETFSLPNVAPGGNDRPLISSTAGVWSWNDQAVLSTSSPTFAGITTTGARNIKVQSITSTPTAMAATTEIAVCNSTSAIVVTLSNATGSGRKIYIKNINTGAVTVTPLATGTADTIDGETTQVLNQWDCIEICDYASDNWCII